MISSSPSTPPAVLLLADHLDAVLAAGEDMLALEVDIAAVARSDGASAPWEQFAELVEKAKLYELTIVSRVLQARQRARDMARALGRQGQAFAPVLDLFASATNSLEDATAELAKRGAADFDIGLDSLTYLRTRGVIPADAGTLTGVAILSPGEDFMVARRIKLGPLLDMSSALLDALDVAYGLFEEDTRQDRTDITLPFGESVNSHETDASRQAAGNLPGE